jgi:hypothetical protein
MIVFSLCGSTHRWWNRFTLGQRSFTVARSSCFYRLVDFSLRLVWGFLWAARLLAGKLNVQAVCLYRRHALVPAELRTAQTHSSVERGVSLWGGGLLAAFQPLPSVFRLSCGCSKG